MGNEYKVASFMMCDSWEMNVRNFPEEGKDTRNSATTGIVSELGIPVFEKSFPPAHPPSHPASQHLFNIC